MRYVTANVVPEPWESRNARFIYANARRVLEYDLLFFQKRIFFRLNEEMERKKIFKMKSISRHFIWSDLVSVSEILKTQKLKTN